MSAHLGRPPKAAPSNKGQTGFWSAALDRLRRSNARQRRLAFLALVFVLISSLSIRAFSTTGPWSVIIDDQVVATVEDRAEFQGLIDTTLAELEREVGQPVTLGEITFRRAEQGQRTLVAAEAVGDLRDTLPLMIEGCYIVVNDEPIVPLENRAAAETAVATVFEGYESSLTERPGVEIISLDFDETVSFEEGPVKLAKVKEAAEAATILERGTDKVVEHVVQKGESLWSIARKTELSVSDLRAANQQVKGDLIRTGDTLNLVVPDPYLNLSSTERYTYQRAISFATQVRTDPERWPWERVIVQHGRAGQKEITVLIDRLNGTEVSRQLVSETLLSEPVVQIVTQGTKVVPNRGTGRLIWPVVGRITSPFGMRGREMHTGIDIGAPRGTPIKAADTGTVIAASYMGGYGNCIMIDHGGGSLITLYAHMSQRAASVGDVVSQGQVIGYVGSTGRSTGNHLHFETRLNGKPINPIQYYPSL